jgi:hypothetical protein
MKIKNDSIEDDGVGEPPDDESRSRSAAEENPSF